MNLWILIVAIAFVLGHSYLFGKACDHLASAKGYGGNAFMHGFFFTIPALIYYAGLPISEQMVKNQQHALADAIADAIGNGGADANGTESDPPRRMRRTDNSSLKSQKMDSVEYAVRVPCLEGVFTNKHEIYCSECGAKQPAHHGVCIKCGRRFRNE